MKPLILDSSSSTSFNNALVASSREGGWKVPFLRGYPFLPQSLMVLRRRHGLVLLLLDLRELEWGRCLGLEVPRLRFPCLVGVLGVFQLLLGDLDLHDLRVGLGRGSEGGRGTCEGPPFPHYPHYSNLGHLGRYYRSLGPSGRSMVNLNVYVVEGVSVACWPLGTVFSVSSAWRTSLPSARSSCLASLL